MPTYSIHTDPDGPLRPNDPAMHFKYLDHNDEGLPNARQEFERIKASGRFALLVQWDGYVSTVLETAIPEITKKVRALFSEKVIPRLKQHTLPFYRFFDDRPWVVGSGVFLRIANEYFILTVSHGIKAKVDAGKALYVGLGPDNRPVSITDAKFHFTDQNEFDVAVIALTLAAGESLKSHYDPISIHDIDYSRDRTPGYVALFGFPNAWATIVGNTVKADPIAYATKFYEGVVANDFAFTHTKHFAFQVERDSYSGKTWELEKLPSEDEIKGISGCGIWRMMPFGSNIETWTLTDCKLMGIQHRYNEGKGYGIATWAGYAVIGVLFKNYPHLQNASKLVLP